MIARPCEACQQTQAQCYFDLSYLCFDCVEKYYPPSRLNYKKKSAWISFVLTLKTIALNVCSGAMDSLRRLRK